MEQWIWYLFLLLLLFLYLMDGAVNGPEGGGGVSTDAWLPCLLVQRR